MCGIGLIVTGVEFSWGISASRSKETPCLEDLLAALRRRGPDSFGVRTVRLGTGKIEQLERDLQISSEFWEAGDCGDDWQHQTGSKIQDERVDEQDGKIYVPQEAFATLEFAGTTLQLRGSHRVCQPLRDSDGNILVYNGEVFGGLEVLPSQNDTEVLLERLGRCDSSFGVCQALSQVRGPWAVIYFQASTRTIWFGRDVFGRRSLLVHWPSVDDPRFLLSSVAPCDNEKLFYDPFAFWKELPCGIHSLQLSNGEVLTCKGEIRTHRWEDPLLNKLMLWDRAHSSPSSFSSSAAVELALTVLKESVERRLVNSRMNLKESRPEDVETPVAVLFSGGIDSMILAALTDQCLDPAYTIDLLNVSFDGPSAPDRVSAIAGIDELRRISPSRKWRLVQVDEDIGTNESTIFSLICPSETYMDLNIGTALWSAARGEGAVEDHNKVRISYKSAAKVVLVGAGADEQCGGYLRYRTKFKLGGWEALAAEMRLDMQRLWKRNLGRDDRCIGDHGKEARFPFLDEDVIQTFLDIPLEEVVDLRQDLGIGDKKILRQVARSLGLSQSASLAKRAIQFGSGIAKKSNRRDFGSNRAANKASAGSVKLANLE
ncbi:asparagine synthetase domain-containing protein 1 [Selaginella moellendorffii]|uniref:asparagine synthetase domain-containing protein 1 n=1 Tax=Selaginella moellendorffii TaxID=88036 RepID=UPI000D1CE45A|nr:asparagine synthetase domain-containing protein 1 [Selaginella moellendorffii]|eukprot:XP_024535743.1 asparagine synthetase domain-containing protein 1 [Selaginella moellendorffii]